jgi:hypothetical protein
MTATRHEYHYDMVTNGKVLHLRAKFDNNTSGFMTKYHRQGPGPITINY